MHFSPFILKYITVSTTFRDGRAMKKHKVPYITDRKMWDEMRDTVWREIWPHLQIDSIYVLSSQNFISWNVSDRHTDIYAQR